ncbi:hypothetical protein BAE44_0014675 [Dichanthelium oligosanthes]|uniref:Uncharacterized protein n=1 Tax=Dichanthelium oligosanthes TaxID=888268 RepID=A0A1E5VGQ7_9POAL|nr:hypothetical protein BAE44_0014675 [Dichanthelium oligosanthes]
MSRFLRPATLADSAAGGLFSAASWSLSSPLALSAAPSSSPSTPVGLAEAIGHLALVRAHPGLCELNTMLTLASFLVDATQTLLASALRAPRDTPPGPRLPHAQILFAEWEEGHADAAAAQAVPAWIHVALLDVCEGHLMDTLVRHGETTPRSTPAATPLSYKQWRPSSLKFQRHLLCHESLLSEPAKRFYQTESLHQRITPPKKLELELEQS